MSDEVFVIILKLRYISQRHHVGFAYCNNLTVYIMSWCFLLTLLIIIALSSSTIAHCLYHLYWLANFVPASSPDHRSDRSQNANLDLLSVVSTLSRIWISNVSKTKPALFYWGQACPALVKVRGTSFIELMFL